MNNHKFKILCVEDEQYIRENIAEILIDEGFDVVEASDGEDGFNKFTKEKPDIIISDIMMPKIDGYDLLKKIRSYNDEIMSTTPVILLTALSQKEDIIKGSNLMTDDYLIKPVDFDVMVAKIKSHIKNRSNLTSIHDKKMNNLKDQLSELIPGELDAQCEFLINLLKLLKEEPYGPIGHRHYKSAIDRCYMLSLKLKASIENSMSPDLLKQKLNAKDDIFSSKKFIEDMINQLKEILDNNIKANYMDNGSYPNIKINRKMLEEVFKLSIKAMTKIIDNKDQIELKILDNHFGGKLFFIISCNSSKEIADANLNLEEAQKTCDSNVLIESKIQDNNVSIAISLQKYSVIRK